MHMVQLLRVLEEKISNKKGFGGEMSQTGCHGENLATAPSDEDSKRFSSASSSFTASIAAERRDLFYLSDATSQLSNQLYSKDAQIASLWQEKSQFSQQMKHMGYAAGKPKLHPQLNNDPTPPFHPR